MQSGGHFLQPRSDWSNVKFVGKKMADFPFFLSRSAKSSNPADAMDRGLVARTARPFAHA